MAFDALLLLSFGGPEGPDDVRPFLANVVRGRPVPAERLEQVVEQYMRFGGRSPINDHNRALLAALGDRAGVKVYWGNRNWAPYVVDAVAQMAEEEVKRAAVLVTSAYSSYSGCRQYLEDLERASAEVGPGAPQFVKLRPFFDHPGFVGPLAEGLRDALRSAAPGAAVLMSAHSLPVAQAATCDYEAQLRHTGRLVAEQAGLDQDRWQLVFQSRTGPPSQPWLGPDINDAIDALPPATPGVVVVPIGFVSDHMEVVYDLDTKAAETAAARGLNWARTPTPGAHPAFVDMAVEIMKEADARPVACRPDCCPPPGRG